MQVHSVQVELGPDTYLSYRALFCRFSGLEAFALDSRRFKNFALGRGAGLGGRVGGGGLISFWSRQLWVKNEL